MTTEFRYCPTCSGDPHGEWTDGSPFTHDNPCPTCSGTGDRSVTEETFQLAISAREWMDEQVRDLFTDYCEAFKIHRAYGVSSWEANHETLTIVQDTSRRGCYDSEAHRIPMAYLYAQGDVRKAMMRRDYDAKEAAKRQEEERYKKARLERLRREAEQLQAEIGG